MNQRSFFGLLLATLVLAGVVLLALPRTTDEGKKTRSQFLHGLTEEINDVHKVSISSGDGNQSTLVLRDSLWVVEELNYYPVDWQKLREVLAAIAQAEVTENKTSSPDYYARLGVEPITAEGAQGHKIDLEYGERQTAIIVGNQASSRDGQYVRLENEAQSVLIDRTIDVESDPLFWVDDEIVDIGSAMIAELEFSHPDGDTFAIRKVSADETDFVLQDLPEGRELISSWTVNSLANAFSPLSLEAVRLDDGLPLIDPVRVKLITFSGLRLEVELVIEAEEGWVRINVELPELSGSQSDGAIESLASDDLKIEARDINDRVNGWLYRIPASKVTSLSKRMDQLLQPLDADNGT